jgi:hypothetical protein
MYRTSFLIFSLVLGAATLYAQDNYEIQVYGADTVEPGATMLEFHTNFTAKGSKTVANGLTPTNHAVHETLELTEGINDWFETGFYVFTSFNPGTGWQWVGDHVRPRVRIPAKWRWPVGVSLSNEIGYQRRQYSADTWTWEMRPIVDKKLGRWYFALNPAIEKALHGENVRTGFEFSPNAKIAYDFSRVISGGLEYYGALGPIPDFDPLAEQEQQFFPSVDLNVSPAWELNFGVGWGATRSTDHLIIKAIVGRRFTWRRAKS